MLFINIEGSREQVVQILISLDSGDFEEETVVQNRRIRFRR
jgi:hypothetical protein